MNKLVHAGIFMVSLTIAVLFGWFFLGPSYYHLSPFYIPNTKAVAIISPTPGNTITGLITFNKETDGVHVVATFKNGTPGRHGIHIHDHAGPNCLNHENFGEHFNPNHQQHGLPREAVHHTGDLGNIDIDTQGNGTAEFVSDQIMLNGPNSIIGRGIIIHMAEDNPSVPSSPGAHIGCGVIGIAKD